MSKKTLTFLDAIREGLEEELVQNGALFLLGEDITDSITRESTIKGLGEKFPGRIINQLPLVEDMLGGIALGMAMGGLKPVIQFDYSSFLTIALNDIYRLGTWRFRMGQKSGPSVVIRVGHEGYAPKGPDLSVSFLSQILHMPNIWIATPSNAYFAKGLLKTALRADQPVIFLEHKALYGMRWDTEIPQGDFVVPFGESMVYRKGDDITILSWSFTSHLSLKAAEELEKAGIQAEVISLETLYPLDWGTVLESARKTKKVVIVDEEMLRGGVSAEISSTIREKIPLSHVLRVGAKNVAVPTNRKYLSLVLPNILDIVNACRSLLEKDYTH